MGYLHSAANKSVGNALVFLKQSLQLHPRSEKLWDLCLELFSRQPVAAQEVIAAFNDATKFNPSSTCLWQRYMHWCNWNIAHGVNSLGDCAVWHSRLSALALAAVKSHVDMQQSPPAERISASLAEIMVCIWEGLWTLLEQQITWSARSGVAPKSAFLKAQLISQMSACLWAKSPMELYTLVSGISADGDSHGPPSRDGGELVFARLLLPHHFLHLGLVFLHCFVAGTFVPQSVLVRMNAALTTSPGRPITAHHLSPRKIADVLPAALELDGALKPHIVSVIRKFFADLQMTLSSYDLSEPADPSYSVITQSLAVCRASMNQTLTQLKQCSPVETAPLINGCEDLFCWIAENPLGSLDIKGLPELIFSHGGIGMFTMVAQLLSKCDLAHNDYASCEMAVHVLREHALLVARQLKVAPTTAMPIVWPVSSVMDTRKVLKRLQRRIVDCRALYYQILGYTGPAQPRSVNTLALGLVNRARDESLEHSRLLLCSGIWINIAAIEFLASRFSADSPSVDVQAIDSALCWLNYGLKHHVANDFGARVQMWAIVLQITAVKRSLTEKDIVLVHHDLGYDADSDALHSPRTDFMPINDVLRPLLLTASSDTLEAVKSYIMHAGYANTELALR
ncbi:hypothetical protein GGF42_005666 [Coemansia sp. RSA 2424]|nr:hypothetical protein GGF42_005666 [Coemansia sp. RSA 2424]